MPKGGGTADGSVFRPIPELSIADEVLRPATFAPAVSPEDTVNPAPEEELIPPS